jgi:hypothetical protein
MGQMGKWVLRVACLILILVVASAAWFCVDLLFDPSPMAPE